MAPNHDSVRAHSARLARHLAENPSQREDIEHVLGTGDARAARVDSWMNEFSFWTDYSKEYPNLRKTGPYRRLCQTVAAHVAPQPDDIWWDAGCGPLSMAEVIWEASHRQVRIIHASDIVIGPARAQLEHYVTDGEDGGTFARHVNLVARTLGARAPFEDGSIDGVVSNLVVPYITLAEERRTGQGAVEFVLREFFRVLRPGRTLVFSVPKKGVRFEWVFVASIPDMLLPWNITDPRQGPAILKRARMIQEKGVQGIYSFLSREEWEVMLRRVGFTGLVHWETSFARQAWVCEVRKPG